MISCWTLISRSTLPSWLLWSGVVVLLMEYVSFFFLLCFSEITSNHILSSPDPYLMSFSIPVDLPTRRRSQIRQSSFSHLSSHSPCIFFLFFFYQLTLYISFLIGRGLARSSKFESLTSLVQSRYFENVMIWKRRSRSWSRGSQSPIKASHTHTHTHKALSSSLFSSLTLIVMI